MYMNLNPLATAALLMIGLSQVSQAWTAIQPTLQETHFRVMQEFCKKRAQTSGDGEQIYLGCMAELTPGKKLRE
jgi:hypothetical protein